MILADCKHMTEPVFVDGRWRTPTLCDDCISENASRPLTEEQTKNFARVSKQLLRRIQDDSGDQTEVGL